MKIHLHLCAMMLLIGTLTTTGALAAGPSGHTADSSAHAMITFRLNVHGQYPSGMTFWIAYGPLAGQFGIVQLSPTGSGVYRAQRRLPAEGRTVFAFLAAYGTIHTRLGTEPRPPLITIRRLGPISAGHLRAAVVDWQMPIR